MMHRDLKSPNVLLSEEGVAKIADVGMVRSQVKDLATPQPVMTPLWAAPEVCFESLLPLDCGSNRRWDALQVIRHDRASIKADIWSYGILIWELISGQDITEMQPLAIARQMRQVGVFQHPVVPHCFRPDNSANPCCCNVCNPSSSCLDPHKCLPDQFLHESQGQQARGKTLELPPNSPSIAAHLFRECTAMRPEDRPSASKIVEWLRHA